VRQRQEIQELLRTDRVKILLTCGPAAEAIDAVRRVTNHSTGALGTALANTLAKDGHEILCLRGEGATSPPPDQNVATHPFFGNSDLAEILQKQAGKHDVILHLAALADFIPTLIEYDGEFIPAGRSGKIRSGVEELSVHFTRAPKLLSMLRDWFPCSRIIGWKYEVEGGVEDALVLGRKQTEENRLDGTVVNGPACGSSLVLLTAAGEKFQSRDRSEFLRFFPGFLAALPTLKK